MSSKIYDDLLKYWLWDNCVYLFISLYTQAIRFVNFQYMILFELNLQSIKNLNILNYVMQLLPDAITIEKNWIGVARIASYINVNFLY